MSKQSLLLLVIPAVVAALALLTTGCGATDPAASDIAAHLTYFRDPKTHLCFAAVGSRTYGAYTVTSITTVPCAALGFAEQLQ